ncbi:MAG: division/cell wall cluster transcriptional repressor MraZ [Bacillota bacterium]|nr:division/cell wall cluster transcriptional repressor MraZ [Bacillota bacterium]NLL26844.1 division/cell wall cluster transcriptional repressor MraZ [Erysipelotrichia bacterium]
MFSGQYLHNLDGKGRIAVPAKFRNELGDVVVVTRHVDDCLAIYSEKTWEIEEKRLYAMDRNKKDVRRYIDFRLSVLYKLNFDSQGRIYLPQDLIEAARLEKECVFTGALDEIKLWSKNAWDNRVKEIEEIDMADLIEGL